MHFDKYLPSVSSYGTYKMKISLTHFLCSIWTWARATGQNVQLPVTLIFALISTLSSKLQVWSASSSTNIPMCNQGVPGNSISGKDNLNIRFTRVRVIKGKHPNLSSFATSQILKLDQLAIRLQPYQKNHKFVPIYLYHYSKQNPWDPPPFG